MFCGSCGNNIQNTSGNFCSKCGASIAGTQRASVSVSAKKLPLAKNKIIMALAVSAVVVVIAVVAIFVLPRFMGPRVGDIIEFGGIEWRVLDRQGRRALIISEYILENRPYHSRLESVTWQDSSLRRYLNDEFYNSFTSQEQKRIAETRVINNDNPWHGTNGGRDTVDKIFLLSLEELVQYFGDSGQLDSLPLGSAGFDDRLILEELAQRLGDNMIATTGRSSADWWWLRSPGYSSSSAARVYSDGRLDIHGLTVPYGSGGVRPALWLKR